MLLWLGDFNYRLNATTYEEVVTSVQVLGREGLEGLRPLDQLAQEQLKGTTMCDMQVRVPPSLLLLHQPHA